MDNEVVIVTLEYHIMAEGSIDAVAKVMECLELGTRGAARTPYNLSVKTITADSGNLRGTA